MTWSDGAPVSQDDYELAYRAMCDPAIRGAGPFSIQFADPFPACDRIAGVEFQGDTAYRVTWKPGFRDPTYAVPPFSRLPAHQQLSDGRELADVPASEWMFFDEVVHRPLGVGPYVLSGWEYGREMILTANPYYYAGQPATPTVVVRFAERDRMVSLVEAGQVDVVGWDSVGPEQAEALLRVQGEGKARVYFTPSTSYEHLEFALLAP